eukprot:CAMPEP_0197615180 /NCGR_PEP_ID=MMETSP1326-20131121/59900_1 /TAXON_ID=1155430 /ORGANISM="Genus nov. species nov., Strain RCC2288" /LENGTH=620 /DNA_ID=CAMNT_0043184061 /DNA_START=140 /DNA_END=1999 /DNA_ORIENTATION=+
MMACAGARMAGLSAPAGTRSASASGARQRLPGSAASKWCWGAGGPCGLPRGVGRKGGKETAGVRCRLGGGMLNNGSGATAAPDEPADDSAAAAAATAPRDVPRTFTRRAAGTSAALSTLTAGSLLDGFSFLGSSSPMRPASASAAELPMLEWLVSDGGSTLKVRGDGTLTLLGPGPGATPQPLSISLPSSATTSSSAASAASPAGTGALLAVDWPGGVRLVVWPASSSAAHDPAGKFTPWAGGISEGFLLELTVPAEVPPSSYPAGIPTAAAELKVDLAAGGRWYGGAHMLRQLWPLDRAEWEVGPLYPFDHGPNGLGSVVGAHWVSSGGTLVAVDPRTPMLHAGLNAPSAPRPASDPRFFGVGIQHLTQVVLPDEDTATAAAAQVAALGRPGLLATLGGGGGVGGGGSGGAVNGGQGGGDGMLRLQARATWDDPGTLHPWQQAGVTGLPAAQRRAFNSGGGGGGGGVIDMSSGGGGVAEDTCVLRAAIAAAPDARAATLAALGSLPAPHRVPPAVILERSIWTTWATSHADVTQAQVLALGAAVVANGYNPGVLEIDDRWQARYGDLEFDSAKFPDPKAMVDQLHDAGFAVTVWVMPFLQEGSSACREARALGHLVEGG